MCASQPCVIKGESKAPPTARPTVHPRTAGALELGRDQSAPRMRAAQKQSELSVTKQAGRPQRGIAASPGRQPQAWPVYRSLLAAARLVARQTRADRGDAAVPAMG